LKNHQGFQNLDGLRSSRWHAATMIQRGCWREVPMEKFGQVNKTVKQEHVANFAIKDEEYR